MMPELLPRLKVQHYLQLPLQALQKHRNLFPLLDQLKIQVGQVRVFQQRYWIQGYQQLRRVFQLPENLFGCDVFCLFLNLSCQK